MQKGEEPKRSPGERRGGQPVPWRPGHPLAPPHFGLRPSEPLGALPQVLGVLAKLPDLSVKGGLKALPHRTFAKLK